MNCPKDDSADCCGVCHYNPVVVIATHERLEITTRNINSLKFQFPQPKIVVVCSNDQEREYYKKLDVTVVIEGNVPLGRKWQAGVHEAHKMDADPLIILGSDDILINGFIKMALQKINEGFDFVGATHWITYDNKNIFHCQYQNNNKDFPIGSGKVYSKKILEKIGYKVFDVTGNRKLDDLGHSMMKKNSANIYLFREPVVLAVKGNWKCMNTARDYTRSPNISAIRASEEVLKKFNY